MVDCRDGRMLVNPNDVYIGQSLITYGEFSPAEGALYRALVGPGDTVVEAGANIGCFTLLFAKLVGDSGRIYAFEPQRLIFQMLCANLALNEIRNVEAWPAGLAAKVGRMRAPSLRLDAPGNFGGQSLSVDGPGEGVSVTTIDNLGLDACTLIKADVQGMERDVLEGARETVARCRPLLYVENDQKEHSAGLLKTIDALGYRAFWHLPRLFDPGNFRGTGENRFPGIVSVNVLCTPPGVRISFAGLDEVQGQDDWWRQE
ncbi:MAG: FkbM family methyltransferase [Rhodobacter sp.]|nr:FkbM family methyltransferase [Rhodobacter sp.]